MTKPWRLRNMTKRSAMIVATMTFLAALAPYSSETARGDTCKSPGPRAIPFKTVNIRNNSDKPIWAVLETAKQDIPDPITKKPHDRWLQAEFDPTPGTYASLYLYRAYVDPVGGIPKQSSVSVRVPFYTQLETDPCPDKPDQYINWWRALRIYIYDDEGAIKHAYGLDTDTEKAAPMSTFAPDAGPGPTCTGCAESLIVYRDQTGADSHGVSLPAVDPSQLLEFTFATVTPDGEPLKIDHGFVDYDISSVDQVYLPVAMDPVNNPFIGFIGSVMRRDEFGTRLEKFKSHFGWPKYKWPPYVTNQDNIRLPATYNVMKEIFHPGDPPPMDPAGTAIEKLPVMQAMNRLWDCCCGAGWPSSACSKPSRACGDPSPSPQTCDNMARVADLFEKNYARYEGLCVDPLKPVPLTRNFMMSHVYGWVPFNECTAGTILGNVVNELKDTPGIGGEAGYHAIANAYIDLQYHSSPDNSPFGDFNRYVELIHDVKYLRVGE